MRRRSGFALPMAVLALALITAAIVAAHSATSAEVITNNAMRAQSRAYQLAEAGLQQFLVRRSEPGFCSSCVANPAVVDSEWTRVGLVGGYADVVAMRVRGRLADGTPGLFLIRSRGVDTIARLSGGGGAVFATRTVGQFATFGTRSVKALGAWTSLNGITNSAVGGRISILGGDFCGGATVAGAVVPSLGQFGGNGAKPSGSPGVDSSRSLDDLKKAIGIDWNAIMNHDAIPADITIPPDGNWPTKAQFSDQSFWPVIRIKKSFTIPDDGRGLLIADSNLTFSSNDVWDGIVLVGGKLTVSGSGSTDGVVVTGLNRTLPGAVNPPAGNSADNDLVNNTKRIQYDACKAARAAERLNVYFAWSNTWLDNAAVW